MNTELKILLKELFNACDHGIPYYAYGDNEAANELAIRLDYCKKMADRISQILIEP